MVRIQIRLAALWLAFALPAAGQRQLESLGRGVVAMRTGTSSAYVGWRLSGDDPAEIAFNLYRASGASAAVKLNPSPITATTDFQDNTADFASSVSYHVRPVLGGVEQPPSASFTLPPAAAIRQHLEIPLQIPPGGTSPDGVNYTYTANDASAGDLDGDGEYELVLRWEPTNSWGGGVGGHTGPVILDAYRMGGTRLWRINLGNNINASAHITQFIVYDLDGDGKAELACMTADGTTDGTGAVLGNPAADYRDANGVVLTGVENLTIFHGETGAALATTQFVPQRHPDTLFPTSRQIEDIWGDGYGNRVNRFLAGVAYVDGQRPSLIFARGYYTRAVISAWDWRNSALTKRWTFDSDDGTPGNSAYRGQGAHSLSIGDLDADGRDEISYGACAIDDDGTGLWSSGLGHGDATHLTDMDLDHPGLELYMPHEDPGSYGPFGTAMQKARSGEVIWGLTGNGGDVGRGVAFDIDPNHPGFEMWASNSGLVFNSKGQPIHTTSRPSYNFGVWWDADLGRELLDQNRIDKWVPATGSTTRLFTASGASSANGTKATPALSADLFGDWREEVVLRASDNTALRVYTTTIPATTRLYTLMHDPHYRVAIAWQNSGYNQPPHPGFYLGYDMPAPPRPPIWSGDLVWKGGLNSNTWDASTLNFKPTIIATTTQPFADGQSVLFDGSGDASQEITLSSNLEPSSVVVHNPESHDYVFAGPGSFAGNMALTKSGPGSLHITNGLSHIGATLVNQGELRLTGGLDSSPVTVQGHGSLTGTGTLGAGLSTEPRGTISPGVGGAGTLAVNGEVLLDGATLDIELAATPAGIHDRLAVTGDLVLTGIIKLRLQALGADPAPGTYTLITYTGTLIGDLANLTREGLVGLPASLAVTPGAIVLEVAATRPPDDITWRGTGDAWDLFESENWLLGGLPTTFVSGDSVTFDATGAAAPTVTLDDTLVPAAVTVSGAASYAFSGSGGIGGSSSLTKSGDGELTISTVNSHTGITSLTGGVVDIASLSNAGEPGPFGAATADPANLMLDNTSLRLTGSLASTDRGITLSGGGATFETPASGTTLVMLGTLTGPGALTKTGSGTLTLGASNSHAGGTIISAGTLRLANDQANQSALGSGLVTLAGGTLTMNNSESGGGDLSSWPIDVPAGFTGRLNVDGRCTLGGTLTGAGTFTFFSGFVRANVTGNWSGFSGQINVITDSGGGEFRVANTAGFPDARLDLAGAINMISRALSGAIIPIGHLTGNAASFISAGAGSGEGAQNPVTWRVGGLGLDGTYAGTIQGGTNLIKEGGGTLVLTGDSNHTGGTTVVGGTLRVNGSTNGSAITVRNGGMLAGGGSITGDVTVENGGGIVLGLTSEAAESLQISGNLAGNGDFLISAQLLGGALVPGVYQVLSYTGNLSGDPTFVWSPPPGGVLTASIAHNPPTGGALGTITVILSHPPREPAEILWTGGVSPAWDEITQNWDLLGNPTNFRAADSVVFDDTGENTSPVDLTSILEPASVRVDASRDYAFGGTGVLSGGTTLEKSGDGMLTVSSAHNFTGGTTIHGGTLVIGNAAALGNGTVTLNGGTWDTGSLAPQNGIVVTADSEISGGHGGGLHAVRGISGSGVLTLTATNVFDLEGDLSDFSGTFAMGGTGSFRFFSSSNNGSAAATFDLGTRSLQARSGAAFSLGALTGQSGSVLQGAGGGGNNTWVTYTIGGNNSNSEFAGSIVNGNATTSIVKTGSGTLTLSGASTYTGTTIVSFGKLSVTGSLATTPVTVDPTGTLGGTGSIGASVTCDGTLAPDGLLTLASGLALSATSTLDYELGSASDLINVTGNLTLDGTLNVTAASGFAGGTHTLISYSGSLTDHGLDVGDLPPGFAATIDTSVAGQVRLLVTIVKSPAAVTLHDLAATYDGSPKAVAVTTDPADLDVVVTYDSSPTPPVIPGVYQIVATVSDPHFEGAASDSLVISPRSFESWEKGMFTSEQVAAGESGMDQDPDRDGLTNLAEYALGGLPYSFTPQPAAVMDETSFSLTFQRPAWIGDITYQAETGVDIVTWQELTLEVLNPGEDPETVRATYQFPNPAPERRFLRLRFER
jgi:fibronectin-binding autotransporter adhesin